MLTEQHGDYTLTADAGTAAITRNGSLMLAQDFDPQSSPPAPFASDEAAMAFLRGELAGWGVELAAGGEA